MLLLYEHAQEVCEVHCNSESMQWVHADVVVEVCKRQSMALLNKVRGKGEERDSVVCAYLFVIRTHTYSYTLVCVLDALSTLYIFWRRKSNVTLLKVAHSFCCWYCSALRLNSFLYKLSDQITRFHSWTSKPIWWIIIKVHFSR